MADTTTELCLIPTPAARLTREEALEWLRDWAPSLVALLGEGFNAEDPKRAAEAYTQLAYNVSQMVAACGRVLASGKSERLLDAGLESGDGVRQQSARQLAGILATKPREALSVAEDGYDLLARRLVDLLAEREAA